MRVVHLTQSTTAEITGGLEHHVAYLADALRRRGHEIIVVNTAVVAGAGAPGAGGTTSLARRWGALLPHAARHRLEGWAETFTMMGRRLFRARHATRVAAHVVGLRPDVVHQHAYLGELRVCWLLAREFPVVFTNHTGAYLHLDRFAPTRWLQRQWMKRFAQVIGPSRELAPRTANSHYVPNGVDTARFFPLPDVERCRLQNKHGCTGKRVFLCPRRWAPTKGIIYLARALRLLDPATRAGSVFLFAGNETPGYGRYQQNVRRELAAAGCDVRVLGNLGHVELAELMNIATACIIPSLMEATSLACLEAMACATPVLGTNTGGLSELIRQDENGWLAAPRDAVALAFGIQAVCSLKEESLRRIGHAAWVTVRDRYTWQNAASATEEIYRLAFQGWKAESG